MFCSSEQTNFQFLFSKYTSPLKGTMTSWTKWLVAGLVQGRYKMNFKLLLIF